MKKLTALVLVLVFAVSLVACTETYPLEGKWKTEVTVLGVEDSGENYALLEFNEDGTGKYTMVSLDVGDMNKFNYTVDGSSMTVTTDSGKTVKCEFEIEGKTLRITSDYKSAEYTRVEG